MVKSEHLFFKWNVRLYIKWYIDVISAVEYKTQKSSDTLSDDSTMASDNQPKDQGDNESMIFYLYCLSLYTLTTSHVCVKYLTLCLPTGCARPKTLLDDCTDFDFNYIRFSNTKPK